MKRWCAICAALLACAMPAAFAVAAEPPSHVLQLEIAPHEGDMPPTNRPLKDACGIAVDPNGRVFVANYYEHEIFVFKLLPEAGFELEATIPVKQPPLAPNGKAVSGPCDLAIDSAGNLYVNRWHYDVLRYPRLSPSAPIYGSAAIIDPNGSTSVAVGTTGSLTDHVFVDDRTYVAEYDSAGAPVLDGGEPVRIGLGSLGYGYGVAVSSFSGDLDSPSTAGLVYVADAVDNTVKVYDPSGDPSVPVQTIDGGGTSQLGFNRLVDADVAVDPVDGHVYVVDNLQPFFEQPEAVLDEFNPLGLYRGAVPSAATTGHPSEIVHAEPSAAAIVDHDVYLTSGNYFNDNDGNAEPPHRDSRALIYGPPADVQTNTLEAVKTGGGSGTVFSSPAGLGCGTACKGEFGAESTVVLTAAAAAHSRFAGWTGCSPLPPAGLPPRCQVAMDADREVEAEFEPVAQLPLALTRSGSGAGAVTSAPAGIDCGPSCVAEFDEGSEVTLTAAAAANSAFSGWSGCDSEPGPGECLATMDGARSVVATFDALPPPPAPAPKPPVGRILSVSTPGAGSTTGTVTSEPGGIACGATCAHVYGDGTTVTLVAHPDEHSALLGWGGCDSSAGLRCTVTLGSDRTVVAAFGAGSPGPLKVRKVTVHGTAAVLEVAVPAAGSLTATGGKVRAVTALPFAAGRISLRVALNGRGRRALGAAGARALPVRIGLAFVPLDGGTTVRASRSVAFGHGQGGRR